MINYIIFGLTVASILFLILSIIYLIKQRILEDKRLTHGINTLIFGLIFLGLFVLVKHIEYANIIFGLNITFMNILLNIASLVFLPLMAVCILVATQIFKEI